MDIKNRFSGALILTVNGDSLSGANLSCANLSGANLSCADLGEADLSGANLSCANLSCANLSDADLGAAEKEKSEFTSRQLARYAKRMAKYRASYPDVPVLSKLDKQIMDVVDNGTGVLKMNQWHACSTTHCRAGWAITLAGAQGKKLEEKYGPARAGAILYAVSTGRIPSFFTSDERALADIRRCAANFTD